MAHEVDPSYFIVEVTSILRAPKPRIWESISTFRGVNYELSPFVTMSCPQPDTKLSIECITPQPLFRSWLFLFGILPFEFDLIKISSFDEGTGFKERSSMALCSRWNHDRTLESVANLETESNAIDEVALSTDEVNTIDIDDRTFTKVVDRLSFRPRFYLLGYLMKYIVKYLFLHRHRRLANLFGGFAAPTNVSFI